MTEKSKEEEEREVCLRKCSEECKGRSTSAGEEKGEAGVEKRGTLVGQEENELEAGGTEAGEEKYEGEQVRFKSKLLLVLSQDFQCNSLFNFFLPIARETNSIHSPENDKILDQISPLPFCKPRF